MIELNNPRGARGKKRTEGSGSDEARAKPVRSGQVGEIVGLGKEEVSKIIPELKKKGKVTSRPKDACA